MRIPVTVLILAVLATGLFSEQAKPGFYFYQDLGASYNALGAILGTRFFYRIPLSDSMDILWASTKIDIGLDNSLTPADDRLTLYINVEPIALFDLTVLAGGSFPYKLLGYGVVDVSGYNADISGSRLDSLPQYDQSAWFLKLTPRIKAQLGPVIFADALDWITMNAGTNETYYYDRREALVLKKSDSVFINNTYLLWDFSNGWYAGLNYCAYFQPHSGQGYQYAAAIGAYDWKLTPHLTMSFNLLLGWYTLDTYRQYNSTVPYIAGSAGLSLKI